MTFKAVFISGAGFMGSAIAYLVVLKLTQTKVILYDLHKDALRKAEKSIDQLGNASLTKGLIAADELRDVKLRLKYTDNLHEAANADLVIEAIVEDLKIKQELFSSLDNICKKNTIFASNTSSLPITALASVTSRAAQFIGLHFFAPPHVMRLVEIIPGLDTSCETVERVIAFSNLLGKTAIKSKDMPGFITTRLGLVLINEAAFALMEGLSTPEEIDCGMTLGYRHPMGPLALADFIGLDTCLSILETLYKGFGDSKYRACPLLKQLVAAGHLGQKTGRGFYHYQAAQ